MAASEMATCASTTCASAASRGLEGDFDAYGDVHATMERLFNSSYVIFRGAVPQQKVERAIGALDSWKAGFGLFPVGGPGVAQRALEILEVDPVFAELVAELPAEMTRIMDAVLHPAWQLGSLHGHILHPEGRQLTDEERSVKEQGAFHSDFPYGHAGPEFGGTMESIPEEFPHTLQLIWMLSPFTARTGATMIMPGSHRNRTIVIDRMNQGDFESFRQARVQVTGEPGDIVLYIGQARHIWGVNEAEGRRYAILGQCLPFFFKHMESHVQKTPWHVVSQMPPLARLRLGFAHDAWFRHSSRLIPLPRSPLEGFEYLLDMLLAGFEGRIEINVAIQLVKKTMQGGFPEEYAGLVSGLAPQIFQLNRHLALLALALPFLLLACSARCSCFICCGCSSVAGAARATALLLVGMTLGVTMMMDRLSI